MDILISAKAANLGAVDVTAVSLRCPHCRQIGIFGSFTNCRDFGWTIHSPKPNGNQTATGFKVGIRICPNDACRGIAFVCLRNNVLAQVFPPELIDLDSTDLPEPVQTCMEEAALCHANGCYRAAALMVRRAIEELCNDKGAQGSNLMQRIDALRPYVTLPPALFDGAHEVRFLGNDAAHVDATTYSSVGKEESLLAIDIAKALLNSVYQTGALVKIIQALKQKPSDS